MKEKDKWDFQMIHDLKLARKIAGMGEQPIESMILSGIMLGRILEREKIQHFINKSNVDVLDDKFKQLLKL